jgi:hypothetical protein
MQGYSERKHRHADGTQRDEAILDLSRRKQARSVAAKAYANGESGLQVSAVRFIDMQNLASVKYDHELQQGAEEPEIGIAYDGEVQGSVRPDDSNLLYEISKNVEAEFPGRVGGRNMRNREARRQTDKSASAKDESCKNLSSVKRLGQQRAGYGSRNNRDESCEFEDAVAPGQQRIRKHLGKQAVFRRAEKCGLRAGEKNHRKGHAGAAMREGVDCENHREDFEDFRADRDTPFAETIRQIASCHRKQKERDGEQIADVKDQEILLGGCRICSEDEENDKEFQAVIIEGTLKLRGDEAPKPKAPLPVSFSNRRTAVV